MTEIVLGLKNISADNDSLYSLVTFEELNCDLKDLVILRRPECETDLEHRHFATYTVVMNNRGQVLTYPRNASSSETRLHGNYSIGVGGHVNIKCLDNANTLRDVFRAATLDELAQELYNLKDRTELGDYLGNESLDLSFSSGFPLIMLDDSNEVGKRHIAVVSIVLLTHRQEKMINPDTELKGFSFVNPDDIKKSVSSRSMNLESWSSILINNWNTVTKTLLNYYMEDF